MVMEAQKSVINILEIYDKASKKMEQKIEWLSVLVKERRKDWQLDPRFRRSRVIGKRRIQLRNHVVWKKFVEIENDLLKVAK